MKTFTKEEQRRAQEARLAGAGRKRLALTMACSASVDALLAQQAGPFPAPDGMVARARRGNMRALVALKCLDCCAGQRAEVTACTCSACPLFAVRPWQGRPSAAQDATAASKVA